MQLIPKLKLDPLALARSYTNGRTEEKSSPNHDTIFRITPDED